MMYFLCLLLKLSLKTEDDSVHTLYPGINLENFCRV